MLTVLSSLIYAESGNQIFKDGFEDDLDKWNLTTNIEIETVGCYSGAKCAKLEGTDDRLGSDIGDQASSTVEYWIKFINTGTEKDLSVFGSPEGTDAYNDGHLATIWDTDSTQRFTVDINNVWVQFATIVTEWVNIRMFHNATTSPDTKIIWYNDTVIFNGTSTGFWGEGEIGEWNWVTRLSFDGIALIDNVTIWEGFRSPDVIPEPNIIVSFRNETDSIFKTVFGEGENFKVFINWIDEDNIPVNDTEGQCNITFIDGIEESMFIESNFTICSTGCNQSILIDDVTMFHDNTTQDVTEDVFHINLCHLQVPQADLDINIQCGEFTDSFTILSEQIDSCSNGIDTFFHNFTGCRGFLNINITLNNTFPFIRRLLIEEYNIDREFPLHLMESGEDIFYNFTSDLWGMNHTHEYYKHGLKDIITNCTHSTDSDQDTNALDQITIVNAPPRLDLFGFIMPDDSFEEFNLSETSLIEFQNGSWTLSFAVIDDDLLNFTVIINNKTQQIFNFTNETVKSIILSSDLFVNFIPQNTFNISLLAFDTALNISFISGLFNITDTASPILTGVNNDTIDFNQSFTFNIQATDEYLWLFNISCTNSHTFQISGLGNTSFSYGATIEENTDTFSCAVLVADGHTSNIMKDIPIYIEPYNKSLVFDGLKLSTVEQLKSSSFQKKQDRYNFCFETLDKQNELNIRIPDGCVIAPDSRYKGHYVCLENMLAIDFESPYKIKMMNSRYITLDISDSKTNNICFDSIVELNVVQENMTITVRPRLVGDFFKYRLDVNTTGSVLLMFMFLIFYIGLWVIAHAFRSFSFGIFGFILGVLIGFMLISFSPYMTILFFLVNIAIMFEFTSRKF